MLTEIPEFVCAICGLRPDMAVVVCPVTLGRGSKFDLVECNNCGTRQVFPLPSTQQLEDFYSTDYFGGDWYKQRAWGRTFAQWHLPRRGPGRYLEVGCGLGYFLDGIRSACEWEVSGVEFGADGAAHARDTLGLDVRTGELQQAGFENGEFDFIRICNVLEHVRDPLAMLMESRRIIKPSGRLHLSIPNGRTDSQALVNFFTSEGTAPLSKDGHLFFFPRQTLLQLLDRSGFEIVQSGTISIRRGLKTLGLYPRKSNWRKPYDPNRRNSEPTGEIRLAREKRRPAIYYHLRRFSMAGRMFRGLCDYGLEFKLLAKPK